MNINIYKTSITAVTLFMLSNVNVIYIYIFISDHIYILHTIEVRTKEN